MKSSKLTLAALVALGTAPLSPSALAEGDRTAPLWGQRSSLEPGEAFEVAVLEELRSLWGGDLDDAGPALAEGESDLVAQPEDWPEEEIATEELAESEEEEGWGLDSLKDLLSGFDSEESVFSPSGSRSELELGPIGYDSQGRPGRIHVVVPGDTLWDISDAYLDTPWIWPSIWQDNTQVVENPHRIYPGEHIWITQVTIRRVTLQEAEEMLASTPAAPIDLEALEALEEEQVIVPEPEPVEPLPAAADDVIVVHTPEPAAEAPQPPPSARTLRVSDLESVGLVTEEQDAAATSIVDSPLGDRIWLGQPDPVYIGLGEGEVEVGDQFRIYRKEHPVYDVDSGRFVGYYVRVLGWLEVTRVYPDSSLATIRLSSAEMQRGDRVIPRENVNIMVTEHTVSELVDGKIIFMPEGRTIIGNVDYVFLNRGRYHGLGVGSALEVYRPQRRAFDRVRRTRVELPDLVLARLTVVSTQEESAVAFVSQVEDHLQLGDRFRSVLP